MNEHWAPCPCGSSLAYQVCCQPFHHAQAFPETAQALMRSRYSAYVLHLQDYILSTWAKRTRPVDLVLESDIKWAGLVVLAHKKGQKQDKTGWVKFKAHYLLSGQEGVMVEKSLFERDALGHWCYVKGKVTD